MQAQSSIAARATEFHPALFPPGKLSPVDFEKTFFFIVCLIGGSQEKLICFENIATHYIIAFLK